MKKSDINNAMLFKIRNGVLLTLLWCDGQWVFYSKERIANGYPEGAIVLDDIMEDLSDNTPVESEYDIVAIKQFRAQTEVIHAILRHDNIEYKWDWMRDKPVEMTLKQVAEKLGIFNLKIISE